MAKKLPNIAGQTPSDTWEDLPDLEGQTPSGEWTGLPDINNTGGYTDMGYTSKRLVAGRESGTVRLSTGEVIQNIQDAGY
ncbi:MAG: hypothetical protein LBQ54_00990 [Planctomycetaceae bacterium]|jgi:hypothetical protein|nr:hypothetical protein [Planctomycetaceae bacterium]